MLVLSLFPGIGLLDMAFEAEGFCVVRGPDLLWGGDVHRFHPPAGKFDGVIGGPPCQAFSSLAALQRANGREPRHGNLIPEFERVITEAAPEWWLMENVKAAPLPCVDGYMSSSYVLNNRWVREAPEQNRVRRFTFGDRSGRIPWHHVELTAIEAPLRAGAVVASHASNNPRNNPRKRPYAPHAVTSSDGGPSVRMSRYTVEEATTLQGLPDGYLSDAPFTRVGKLKVIANGVPLPMGRAIARAVKATLSGA